MNTRPLVFIPTYNERENAKLLCEELLSLEVEIDILFMDDNSPDGTGQLLEEISKPNPRVNVVHRTGKLGVGSAHYDGIQWAYSHGYQKLVTMDCDFTHPPAMIPQILEVDSDVVVGSRYLKTKSLRGWNIFRKFLTRTGHLLTRLMLGMPYDATGGFRYYRLDRIPYFAFHPVSSKGYSFFFESLCILHLNGYEIKEIPIALPPRTYGHSKMSYKEIFRSLKLLLTLYTTKLFNRERLEIVEPLDLSATADTKDSNPLKPLNLDRGHPTDLSPLN